MVSAARHSQNKGREEGLLRGLSVRLRSESFERCWGFIHLLPGWSAETEGQSQRPLPGHPADRLGRESHLQGPHHVHEPLWRQVGFSPPRHGSVQERLSLNCCPPSLFLCRQQALFHVLAAYSIYNTVSSCASGRFWNGALSLAVAAGGGLLPGNESDHSPAAHLHERGRRLLGSGQAAVWTEARHAR